MQLNRWNLYLAAFPYLVSSANTTTEDRNDFFCSQLVGMLLKQLGLVEYHINERLLSPTLLFQLLYQQSLPQTTLSGVQDAKLKYRTLTDHPPQPLPHNHYLHTYPLQR